MKIAGFLILAAAVTVVALVVGVLVYVTHSGSSGGSGSSPPVTVRVAADAGRVLGKRQLVFSLGRGYGNADIWEVRRGGVTNVTGRIRSGPDPQQAYPFSLSPDGEYIALFLQTVALGACSDCLPLTYFIRSNGSAARRFGRNLCFCTGYTSLWRPSWDPSGHSFVIAAPKTGLHLFNDTNSSDYANNSAGDAEDDDSGLFRFEIPSGRETELTRPGQDDYDYAAPAVSPDGRRIAFLRSVAREPSNHMSDGVTAYVYVMSADGQGKRRLPLPPHAYSSLWWCRGSDSVCVDAMKHFTLTANTYRIDLRTGRVDLLRHWPEQAYVESGALSRDASFAVSERTSRGRTELLAGPLAANGTARLKRVVTIPRTGGVRVFGVSIGR